ncbi:MAG: DUF4249 domain-containing protein [Bacteroidales bacterium]
MKNSKNILFFFIVIGVISLFSCQKVIDVDLNEAASRLVIEGNITPEPGGRNQVLLSTSGGYFDNSAVQPVENGIVKITDEYGNSEFLEEFLPGTYYSHTLVGTVDTEYSIEVIVDGQVYTGSDYLPPVVPIDSLYYEIDDFTGPGDEEEGDRYNILLTLSDPIDRENYYRIVTYINGDLVYGGFNPYRVIDDELINGLTFTLTIRGTEIVFEDTVVVELQSIGFNTYEYFSTLNDALSGGGLGSTPYNPITNLDNGAVGYFGAYSVSKDTVIIDEQ